MNISFIAKTVRK